jgi:adenylate kinase family enzyme
MDLYACACRSHPRPLPELCSTRSWNGWIYTPANATDHQLRWRRLSARAVLRTMTESSQQTMRRLVVIGAPGSGKTTFAVELSKLLNIAYIGRDQHTDPNDPPEEFPSGQRRGVMKAIGTAASGWILDGAPYWYEADVYPITDTILAFDYPKPLVLWRCVRRTASNLIAGREKLRELLNEEHPLSWAWKVHGQRRTEISRLLSESQSRVIVFRSPKLTRHWLHRLRENVQPERLN